MKTKDNLQSELRYHFEQKPFLKKNFFGNFFLFTN